MSILDEPYVLTRGDLQPDAQITIGDAAGLADFSQVTPSMCYVNVERDGALVSHAHPGTVTPAGDKKSAVVKYSWGSTDTDTVGVLYISVTVTWPGLKPQTFPRDTPLIVYIRRAPGDP